MVMVQYGTMESERIGAEFEFFDLPVELQVVILSLAGPRATILTLSSTKTGLKLAHASEGSLPSKLASQFFGTCADASAAAAIPRFGALKDGFEKLRYLVKYWKIDFSRDPRVQVTLADDPFEEEKPKFDGVLRLALFGPPQSGKVRDFPARPNLASHRIAAGH